MEQPFQREGGARLGAVEQARPSFGARRWAQAGNLSGQWRRRSARPRGGPAFTDQQAARMWARGARSPEAPTEPFFGTTGRLRR